MIARGSSRPAAGGTLVPIDGSRNSLRALDYAIGRAKPVGAPVHVVNVEFPMDAYGMVGAYMSPREHRHNTAERARAILAPALERLAEAGIPHEGHVVWGEPAASIVRTAKRLRSRDIVMSTRGMGAAGNLLLGSTANKVVHLAKVPVTLVK